MIFLTCAVALTCAAIVGFANYMRISKIALNAAVDQIAGDTRELALRFDNYYQQMINDAYIVSYTPPIQGFIRTLPNNGIDPLDGSTSTLWKKRLETIFKSVMKERPYYTKMRYIEFANNGQELVRVLRTGDKLEGTPLDELQTVGDEDYLKNAKNVKKGLVHISDVNFNREHGRIDPSMLLTQRVIVPIQSDTTGELFGVIIINVNYIELLKLAFETLAPPWKTYIVNHNGDHLVYYPETKSVKFFYSQNEYAQLPKEIRDIEKLNKNESLLVTNQSIYYLVRYFTSPNSNDNFLDVVVEEPKAKALAEVYTIQNDTIYILGLLILIAVILGAYYGHLITKPLHQLATKISQMSTLNEEIDLPISSNDEIGMLATSLKKAIDASKESEARYKAILEDANDSIVITNQNGFIESCNPASEKLFGYTTEELNGLHITTLVSNMEITDTTHENAPKGITNTETEGKRKDGSTFPVELTFSTINTKNNEIFTLTMRDNTERKKNEEILKSYTEALEESNNELDQFAYVASHDLKAPLRVIDNASRWLEEDLADKVDEESKENLKLMQSRVSRMERLLEDLLEYSRIGRKVDKRFSEKISGDELMQNILGLLSPPEGFSISANEEFKSIQAMKMPLEQILLNLISNAIKHHDKEKGSIKVSVSENENEFTFRVQDDGPGIPEKFHKQIFQMFQTLQPRDKVEGSGMGLAMVQKHIETAGGTLRIESEEGKGSTFIFTWPKKVKEVTSVT